jgi:hypothetical protein
LRDRASFLGQLTQTLRLLRQRAGFYAAGAVLAIALQAAFDFTLHGDKVAFAIDNIVSPAFTAIVYAFAWADLGGFDAGAAWSRAVERVWAVIVIDFLLAYASYATQNTQGAGDTIATIADIGIIVAGAFFLMADAAAVFDDDASAWKIVPLSFAHSVIAAVRGGVFLRVLTIVAVDLLLQSSGALLADLLGALHVPNAPFWATVPLESVTIPFFAILTALVYRDAYAAARRISD